MIQGHSIYGIRSPREMVANATCMRENVPLIWQRTSESLLWFEVWGVGQVSIQAFTRVFSQNVCSYIVRVQIHSYPYWNRNPFLLMLVCLAIATEAAALHFPPICTSSKRTVEKCVYQVSLTCFSVTHFDLITDLTHTFCFGWQTRPVHHSYSQQWCE